MAGHMQDGNRNDVVLIILNELVQELKSSDSFLAHIEGGKVTLKRGIKPDKVRRADGAFPSDSVSYLYPSVGKDVFILGYPLGVELSGIFPIWKRGSIASEPQADIQSGGRTYKNIIYIDALTKAGMSGAPVIALTKTGDFLFSDDGVTASVEKEDILFVGVYAGREGVTQEEFEFSMGRIWKAQTVAELYLASQKKRLVLHTRN